VPLVVDNTVATPILLRPIEYGADVVVHSMTKFIGGGGTSIGGMIVDGGKFPWRQYPEKYYMFNVPEIAYHGVVYVDPLRRLGLRCAMPHRLPAKHRGHALAVQRIFCFYRESRRWLCVWSDT